ncbi:zinc finger protein, putative [Ixodes scapularis]|uniref:Zinc finger protein, putative n=1 Tax=Ixodes scapularis TaxID=6945 RepID=B7QGF2_IXOSC|nr:zinc finger protein, putative [Ixodes scapularis]|eukprot:XP_002401536.1 zinc finger protein, putative [Ixodes scapularis]
MVHLRIHAKERRPFQCTRCALTFRHQAELFQHMQSPVAAGRYPCGECGLALDSKCALALHLHSHTPVATFQCAFCPTSFTREVNLAKHMHIHTRGSPFKLLFSELDFLLRYDRRNTQRSRWSVGVSELQTAGRGKFEMRRSLQAKELQSLQGSNVGSTTRKIMAYLMTDEVASLFSWLGRKGKAKFCELNMASAIVHVVKKCHSLGANLEVEETMKAWLRHAPGRCRNPALLVPAAVPALQQAKNI